MKENPGERSVALTRNFRLLQKVKGHRYSVDDMLVAHLACTTVDAPTRALDLGCGLGSVLLISAWAFPGAELVGVEAEPEHVDFARRNVRLNGCEHRVEVRAGELRDRRLLDRLGRFDLVTGTPPYFPEGSGTPCADPVRTAAHFELRGGIEAYAEAARRTLLPDGRFGCCAPFTPPQRAVDAIERAGLTIRYLRPVLPRVGKPPFLVLMRAAVGQGPPASHEPALVLRDERGRRTEEHRAIRRWTM